MAEKVVFHVDMDAFYASVEQRDNPALRGKPVIIGAEPGKRGVVSACSYEARKFGVRSALPINEAFKLCPKGVFLPVRMGRYQEVSAQIMEVFDSYSPSVLQISIDEAFLDMTGTEGLFGRPEEAAENLKNRVKTELELTLSIGIAANRFLAKLASDYRKPDGLFHVLPGKEIEFLDSLKLKSLWGLGDKTLLRLEELNIRTIQELRSFPESTLRSMLGNASGTYLYRACRGIDPGIYQEVKSHSVSNEITFERDTKDKTTLRTVILELSQEVMYRLLRDNKRGRTAVLKLRYSDFTTTTAQESFNHPLSSGEELFQVILKLLEKKWDGFSPLRLIGIGVTSLESRDLPNQQELFGSSFDKKKKV